MMITPGSERVNPYGSIDFIILFNFFVARRVVKMRRRPAISPATLRSGFSPAKNGCLQ